MYICIHFLMACVLFQSLDICVSSVWVCSLSPAVMVSSQDFTVDLSRNQAEPQLLSVLASPAAPLFLFPCAEDREAASRSGNIAATSVWSAGRWRQTGTERVSNKKLNYRHLWVDNTWWVFTWCNWGLIDNGSWAASGNFICMFFFFFYRVCYSDCSVVIPYKPGYHLSKFWVF